MNTTVDWVKGLEKDTPITAIRGLDDIEREVEKLRSLNTPKKPPVVLRAKEDYGPAKGTVDEIMQIFAEGNPVDQGVADSGEKDTSEADRLKARRKRKNFQKKKSHRKMANKSRSRNRRA